MSNNLTNPILLVGVGPMAVAYSEVLKAMGQSFVAISRSEASALSFTEKTGVKAISGGVENFLLQNPEDYSHAIVATGVEALADATKILLQHGVKSILLEKPGAKNIAEIEDLHNYALGRDASIFLAYNRRFYASVLKAKEIIAADGGVLSLNFEFTEWGHVIEKIQKAEGVKENWFLANSTHVADLAFYIAGVPAEMVCFTSGGSEWHPSATIFAGSGKTVNQVIFNYQANWDAPGRWGVEILTAKHRLYLRPLEDLSIQEKGSVAIHKVEFDDGLDKSFKPGLYLQVKNWLSGECGNLCTLTQQNTILPYYKKMSNY